MKKQIAAGLLLAATLSVSAQDGMKLITPKEATRIETFLSSDELRGRKTFSPEIDKAADFIAREFKAAGLQTLNKGTSYQQPFSMVQAKLVSTGGTIEGKEVEEKNIIAVTCQPELKINEQSGYEIVAIKPGDNLFREARKWVQAGKNLIVLVPESFSSNFSRLSAFKRGMFKTASSVFFILSDKTPTRFAWEAKHEITEQPLANVVGILPGRSKKDEYVIFSGHYDHIGVGKAVNGDSIYNGANDDAAGTTAVIMLARYFAAQKDNERTLVFAAFTAEEIGGFGSQYFSRQFEPDKVMAMFNIEMIGTESKWGKNSAYITGYEKTDMGKIMGENLKGTGFEFHPDPYPDQQLFYRSDNATLARLGVPAHTISTSKMDSEPNYHKVSDEIGTLDMENMAAIIRAIALSSRSIVSGKDTPTRVNTEDLR